MQLRQSAPAAAPDGPDLAAAGLFGVGAVHWNLGVPALYEHALRSGEARLSNAGALVALTGARTGRSPQHRFIVEEPATASDIWWGEVNRPVGEDVFDGLHMRAAAYLRGRPVFVQDVWAGADPEYRLAVRVVTEHAWHSSSPGTCSSSRNPRNGAASRRPSPSSTCRT